ncbi:MAG TPA: aldo/keto reductase [Mycobacteriales bacterium]|nr:aldo/keto reductase [Mycobacteriales bacterium]
MTLQTAALGSTGMEITRVGFGAWAVGGGGWRFGWGAGDDDSAVRAITHAVECGVNWIDTAPVYGMGHSEEVVGQALRALPDADRPLVFTKCGLVFDRSEADPAPRNVLAPHSVRRELEDTLRRLGVERVDLYQVHWPPEDGTPLEVYWGEMVALREEGKVRAIGLSNHDVKHLEACESLGHVDSLQPPFSLVHRDSAADLLPWCSEHGTGAIVYSPMQSGLLSGAMTSERVAALPEDDWRRTHADFTDDLDRNLALAAALEPVATRHGVAVAAVAVAWTLAWTGVTGAIVGARTPEQVDDWLPAAGLVLTDEDLEELAAAVLRTGAGEGPTDPRMA